MRPFETETARFLSAWMQVRQLVQASNFNRFHRAGLSATQFMTLNVIPGEGATLTEIARRLNLSASSLNATVNSLQERGFLARKPDPRDARRVIIRATRRGQAMQNSASRDFHLFIAGLFARMSAGRREGLLSGLEQLVTLGQAGAEDPALTSRADAAPPAKRSSSRSPRR